MIDVLVIGGGGAGLTSALSASANGAKVAILSQSYPTRAQTSMAQGGINAVLHKDEQDSIELHIKDTLKVTGGLASEKMITYMCENAKDAILWLESIGVPFSRDENGKIAQRTLGGASKKRACYSQDYTGLKILHTLHDQCLKEEVEFLHDKFLLNILTKNNKVQGINYLDIKSGEVAQIATKSIILATGGYGGIYHGYTTNDYSSTGDGIVAAFRAGAKVAHMEFIQFHPTTLKNSKILISESARGAGGKLINQKGERFVDELKPRDEVSRAVFSQIQNANEVFLDIRHFGEKFINENLPQERKLAITYEGVDPVSQIIPITPAAHYTMGGIDVDEHMQSSVQGLFAVGETACSKIHGANRLGGNSLLEIVVFGKLAAQNALKFARKNLHDKPAKEQLQNDKNMIADIYKYENKINFYEKRELLGKLLYKKCGIVRKKEDLIQALETLHDMKNSIANMGIGDKGEKYNTNLIEFLKFINTLEISKLILEGAIKRDKSVGAHFIEN